MSWWHKEPGHHQPWYWPTYHRISTRWLLIKLQLQLECAASNGNRYPPYPQVYWMLSVSHLDTSACQIVGHFFQTLCMQYTNPSPWMVGRTDERMKWQQYPSASMLAKGKSSGNICISNSMPFLPSDLSANVQKPENVVNRPIDGQTDGQTDGQKSGRGALLLGGIALAPSTWFRRKMW